MVLGCAYDNRPEPGRAMRSGAHHFRAAAGDMLGQLLPHNVLRDGRDFVLKFPRDQVFRDYILTRLTAVVLVGLVFVLVSTLCAIGVMFFTAHLIPPPAPLSLRAFAFLLGTAVWLGGLVAQAYVFLIWLEGRAAMKNRKARGVLVTAPTGVLAYLKYHRALAPWILVAICVVLPLAILAVYLPLIALSLVCLEILTLALFNRFDS
jgi:hypothetical protein